MDRQSLENAISQLDSLIVTSSATEDDFQKWFETNPLVFKVLGYQKVIPHPRLTEAGVEKYIPDFLAQRVDGLWEIIEIKRPDTEMLKDTERRTAFYSAMESCFSQCREYSQYFDDRANRQEFASSNKESVERQPPLVLIAGRSQGLNRQKVHELLSGRVPSILHQTYDDVRNRLEFQRANIYGAYENLHGLSIHLILAIERPSTAIETFIFDIGTEGGRDRLSLHTDPNGTLLFNVRDSSGVLHQAVVLQGDDTFQYERTFYLSLEVGFGAGHSVMVVEKNSRYCSEHKLSGLSIQLDTPMPLVIGSDLKGQAESSMRIAEECVYNRTLSFHDKTLLRNYFFENYKNYLFDSNRKPKGHEFRGRQFLYSEGHPRLTGSKNKRTTNMIQEDPTRRPVLREAT